MSNKEELIMLYEFTGTRISEFKSNQWAVTNYGSVLYASIISTKRLIDNTSWIETIVLNSAALIIMISGIWLISQFSQSIKERQLCLKNIRAKFGDEFVQIWGGPKEAVVPKTLLKNFHIFILILGFLFTSFLLWRI